MNHVPTVSIGLPVFNGEPFLESAIQSILQQTFRDFELIITDNASSDGTEALCRRFAGMDSRIRYVRHDRNLGAAENYNRAFTLSSGRYFKWASHDDVCGAEFFEKCVSVLDADQAVVVAYPRTMIIDENGAPQGEYSEDTDLNGDDPRVRFRNWLFDAPGECNAVFGLIRSSVLRQTPLIGKYKASDMILLGELALAGRLQRLPEVLFFRRDHAQTSVRAHHDDAARIAWFDPNKSGKVTVPRLRWLREYASAIRRSSVGMDDKIVCTALLGKWLVQTRRKLKRELVAAAKQRLGRARGAG